MVQSKVLSAIALCLSLTACSLAGCEDKGVPVPPAPDKANAPAESASAAPSTEPGAAEPDPSDTKDAKAEDPDKEEPKTADTKDPKTSKSAEPKDTAPVSSGEKKEEGSYAAWLQTSGKYKVGQGGAVVAIVSAQGEYHCNDDYPYKFKVGSAPDGVSFASTTVSGASVGKKQTTLRIPFTPSSAGSKNISGTFYFSVCNESTCQIKKQALSVTVNVEN